MKTTTKLIALESFVLGAICLLDLATTVFWVSYRNASEGNPLMAFYLHRGGTLGFIAAKLVLCVMPLFIAEWARRTNPRFVHSTLRFGIVAYIALYGIGVFHVNQAEAVAAEEEAAMSQYTFPLLQEPDSVYTKVLR